MSTSLENSLFYQFKQNDYILFNAITVFVNRLGKDLSASYQAFKASWDNLQPDQYLVDDGAFRLRRYAVLKWQDASLQTMEAEAHFQSKHYNVLYGGLQRVFAPIEPHILVNDFFKLLIGNTIPLFDRDAMFTWRVQCHQFRIKTSLSETGKPTPEGIHQDGADYVFIMLLKREGISGGVSELFDANNQRIVSTVLGKEGDAMLLNDKQLWHHVTDIRPDQQSTQGYRDVLVLTFHRLSNV